ncbi:uncharacterized protein LOC133359978 isoform X2 [Lethenteron reissneri]|uniref:uncharacterized protein LOC133359978 isoform X2 n=1 Tax=Lethenteron reissneri TaxID=7753 RepID=UPI002AB7F0B2|nr:uncharacterized protein LOC133359978 isoform X2 [Lethenteron reissneri]
MKTPTAAEASVRRCQTLIYLYFLVCARCEGLFEVWVQQWVSAATGETAILPCNYTCNQNSEHFEFHWLRILNSSKEKIFSKNSKGEVTFLERAHWLGTTDLCNASIAIRDVRPSDSGSYLCQVLLLPSFNEGQTSLILEVVATRDEGRELVPQSPYIRISIALVAVLVCLLSGAFGYYVCKKWKSESTQQEITQRSTEQEVPLNAIQT